MDETTREIRVSDDAATQRTDESREQETSAVLTARLLANPRRIRVN
jgi:hypothetical protein